MARDSNAGSRFAVCLDNTHSTFAIQTLLCCLLNAGTLALKIYCIAHNYSKHMMDVFSLHRDRMLYETYNEW